MRSFIIPTMTGQRAPEKVSYWTTARVRGFVRTGGGRSKRTSRGKKLASRESLSKEKTVKRNKRVGQSLLNALPDQKKRRGRGL